jgi:hypothetical protein
LQLLHPPAIIIAIIAINCNYYSYLVDLLHPLNLRHGGRLETVHDRFISEVAIHSQVENIFKMSWSHAITKVAQHYLTMLVVEYTCLTLRYALTTAIYVLDTGQFMHSPKCIVLIIARVFECN